MRINKEKPIRFGDTFCDTSFIGNEVMVVLITALKIALEFWMYGTPVWIYAFDFVQILSNKYSDIIPVLKKNKNLLPEDLLNWWFILQETDGSYSTMDHIQEQT